MQLKDRIAPGEPLIGAEIYSGSPEILEYAARGMNLDHVNAGYRRMKEVFARITGIGE